MPSMKGSTIITIGRTFGSGGREIGRKVADTLQIPFYDKELMAVEAKEGRLGLDYLNMFDEKQSNGFIYAMAFNPYVTMLPYMNGGAEPLELVAQNIQIKAIKTVADRGPCVIVGRRADKVLRDGYDTLNVFISAPLDNRVERVSARDGLSEKDSRKTILKADKVRRSFYNSYGDGDWGDAANYHLCIDSGALGIDNSATMILHYLRLKEKLIELLR